MAFCFSMEMLLKTASEPNKEQKSAEGGEAIASCLLFAQSALMKAGAQ